MHGSTCSKCYILAFMLLLLFKAIHFCSMNSSSLSTPQSRSCCRDFNCIRIIFTANPGFAHWGYTTPYWGL